MMTKEPGWTAYQSSSFNLRQDIVNAQTPRLGHKAAVAAVENWGRPTSEITHLIVCSTGAVDIPGADYHILSSMGLSPTTKRFMLSQLGCYGGGTVLRLAKDLVENNPGARVLAVCSKVSTASGFRGPCESHVENLIGQALFGDGASAVIVGAPPFTEDETAPFELVSATQHIIPNSHEQIVARFREEGWVYSLHRDIAETIATNIEMILKDSFRSAGISPPADWNSLFWVVHPGGRAILDKMETKLGLRPEKLRATREVLRQYGNVLSACLFLVIKEMKEWSENEEKMTAGEGDEVGVVLGIGPGLTVKLVVIRCSHILR